jgi:hypothetical protein
VASADQLPVLYIPPMFYIELAIVAALILLNGLLALAELAIVSSRRARLRALVDRGVVGARRALALATDPGRFLSTVQIGITLVGVLSGAFSGATLGLHLAEWFVDLGLPKGIAEALGVGLVVAVITYFSLAPSAAGPFPCSGRAWNFFLVQREGRRYRLMQREGKPSPAYPNAGPALLLAGLFLWSLLDDAGGTKPRRVCTLQVVVVIPMASKDRAGFQFP